MSTDVSKPSDTQKPVGAIVVDLGKKKRKQVRRLRKGKGPLLDKVEDALAELKEDGAVADNAQPIIVIVRERPRAWY